MGHENDWDIRGNEEINRLVSVVLPQMIERLHQALEDAFRYAKYFVSFQQFQSFIFAKLQEKMNLPDQAKAYLSKEFERIYKQAQKEAVKNLHDVELGSADIWTIQCAEKLADFYMGGFFQGDTHLRLEVIKWMNQYYLTEGHAIGKGQEGIREFVNRFGQFLTQKTEYKVRQILDTTYNQLKNSARIRAFEKAEITYYQWSAVGDRLTCPYCNAMDGRIFQTSDAIRTIDMIDADPQSLPDVRPFLTSMPLPMLRSMPSSNIPSTFPPAHPSCRCTVEAFTETERIPITVERAIRPANFQQEALQTQLENEYRALKPEEISNRIRAHLGSDWRREANGNYDTEAKRLAEEFEKHGQEVGAGSVEEYERMSHEIIRNPDKVYIQRIQGPTGFETHYIFVKGDKAVVSSDNHLGIKAFHKLKDDTEDNKSQNTARIRVL